MKTNVTGGNEEQGSSTITGETIKGMSAELEGFNLEGIGSTSPQLTEQEKADKEAADKAKLDAEAKAKAEAEAAAKKKAEEANGGSSENEEEFFEFENKKFKLDENGNALNEDGTVFKTKKELEDLLDNEESNEPAPLIDEVIQLNGIQILDEKTGIPKVYEDSIQGILEYTKDVAEFQIKQSQLEFFKKYPQVTELAKHIANGGSEEDFYKQKAASWKNFNLDITNENQLVDVITKDLLAKGFSKEDAAEMVTLYKDSNKLEEKGKIAVESRRKEEERLEVEKQQKIKQQQIEQDKKIEAHWKEVSEVVKKGKLDKIVIPESDKDGFLKYISISVNEQGYSQYDLDEISDKLESDLQYKYLRYKKFDLSKLVKNAASSERVLSLRERLKKQNNGTNNGGGDAPIEKANPLDLNITLNTVLGQS